MERSAESSSAAEAFGVPPPSWWERLLRRDTGSPAPVRVAGLLAPLAVAAASSALRGLTGVLAAFAILSVPAWLERHYRARRRREQEQLLPPP